MRLQNKGDN